MFRNKVYLILLQIEKATAKSFLLYWGVGVIWYLTFCASFLWEVYMSQVKKTFFLWMGFNCLKARATLRRQFTFYHKSPEIPGTHFIELGRMSRPWSHPVVVCVTLNNLRGYFWHSIFTSCIILKYFLNAFFLKYLFFLSVFQ